MWWPKSKLTSSLADHLVWDVRPSHSDAQTGGKRWPRRLVRPQKIQKASGRKFRRGVWRSVIEAFLRNGVCSNQRKLRGKWDRRCVRTCWNPVTSRSEVSRDELLAQYGLMAMYILVNYLFASKLEATGFAPIFNPTRTGLRDGKFPAQFRHLCPIPSSAPSWANPSLRLDA